MNLAPLECERLSNVVSCGLVSDGVHCGCGGDAGRAARSARACRSRLRQMSIADCVAVPQPCIATHTRGAGPMSESAMGMSACVAACACAYLCAAVAQAQAMERRDVGDPEQGAGGVGRSAYIQL